MRRIVFLFLFLPVFSCHTSKQAIHFNPYQYTINKTAKVKNGAVVSAHPLASKVGLEILKEGGNAIDAAMPLNWHWQ